MIIIRLSIVYPKPYPKGAEYPSQKKVNLFSYSWTCKPQKVEGYVLMQPLSSMIRIGLWWFLIIRLV